MGDAMRKGFEGTFRFRSGDLGCSDFTSSMAAYSQNNYLNELGNYL